MQKLKKIGLFLLGIMVIFGFNFQFTYGIKNLERDHDLEGWSQEQIRPSTPKMSGSEISTEDTMGSGTKAMGNKIIGIINLPQVANYNTELGYLLAIIKIAVNRILAMLSFVALIYMLYCGFLVFSSGTDEKNAAKGKKGIKTATIAIAGIGLAWLIISSMIRFIGVISNAN